MASTRGHSSKVVKPRCRLDTRTFSFAHRVVDSWNGLDESIIACDLIKGLKNRTAHSDPLLVVLRKFEIRALDVAVNRFEINSLKPAKLPLLK